MEAGENPGILTGRLTEETADFVRRFTASIGFDQRLCKYDVAASIVHARMLCRIHVLTAEERDLIVVGLRQIEREAAAGALAWSIQYEDVHMNVERRLTEITGEVGKKLHTARSRNDQVATDIRLFLREEIDLLSADCRRLLETLLVLSEREAASLMPGMTHLQSAQPVTFGHHFMAWAAMLERDLGRLADCRKRVNLLPLGAGALAGVTYAIDREFVAQELGFDGLCDNSLDAVSDRDFAIEFCAVASILMMHFSRWGEELILWSSLPFDFVVLPDRFCTGSSIMPQKKNPDVAELVRGKTGRVYGALMALLTVMKSQPLAYNKDNQEDKEPLFDTVDTVRACVCALDGILAHLQIKRDRAAVAAGRGFSTATDLADYLVRKGVAFRDAHEAVGAAVAKAIARGCDLADLPPPQLQLCHPKIGEGIRAILTPEGAIAARNHSGGTAPERVRQAISSVRKRLLMVNRVDRSQKEDADAPGHKP